MEKRIGFGKRLGAYVLDIVIISALAWVIGMIGGAAIFGAIMGAAETGSAEGDAAMGALGAGLGGMMAAAGGAIVVSVLVYLLEGLTGVTPGKMILGIKVGQKDGATAGVGSLFTRFLVKVSGTILTILAGVTGVAMLGTIGGLCSLVIFIGCFFVLGAQKQSIHDMVAKTAVFNKADLA